MIQFDYCRVDDWPPLAWLAVCWQSNEYVKVFLGRNVEASSSWFCEAAWAGEYAAGDFDQIEIVAGSGGRARADHLTFVSSASTVDRLHALNMDDRVLVSNSLPCLLNVADASLRPSYPFYNRELHSITQGLSKYRRFIETSAGNVQLCYFDNLVWNGRSLRAEPRPDQAPHFAKFDDYSTYLENQLRRLINNANSAQRMQSPFQPLATISTGYDSPSVATMASRCGCHDAISFDSANSGLPDSGAAIARTLGLNLTLISPTAWRKKDRPEIPIFASGQAGAVIFAGAEDILGGTLLLTGFSGDTVWDQIGPAPSSDIVRGDTSGLGLTEYRLWAGFLHCPIPFWGARKAAQIQAISNSPEMRQFVIPDSDYNRPICRRIVEETGVARDLFGREKKAAEPYLWLDREFLTPASYRDYLNWLHENRSDWIKHCRVPPWRSIRGDAWLNTLSSTAAAITRRCGKSLARVCRSLPGLKEFKFKRLSTLHPPLLNLRRYWFPWAVDRAKKRYSVITPAQIQTKHLQTATEIGPEIVSI